MQNKSYHKPIKQISKRFVKLGLCCLAIFLACHLILSIFVAPSVSATSAEPVQWQDDFLQNGHFNTSAAEFPSNYTFKITKKTLQNQNTNSAMVATLKKELFYAIKNDKKTITLVDNCASYVIEPENVKPIEESEFSQIVQLGSYYRTGSSYPPAARAIAVTNQKVAAGDEQFLMGRDFSFWQIGKFPDVLTSCTVKMAVTNAGMSESGADAQSADWIAKRFHSLAKDNSLYAYIYRYNANNPVRKPEPGEGNSVSFEIDSARTFMFTGINMTLDSATQAEAQAVINKINAIPTTITSGDVTKVTEAHNAYNALTASGKALIENDYKLFAAEVKILINKIPESVTVKAEDAILTARVGYDSLSTKSKKEVNNFTKLEQAEKAFKLIVPPIKVACVGDSITKGVSYSSNQDTKSYPAQLQQMIGLKYEVKNFGVGGRTLLENGDYSYWDELEFASSAAFSPNIIIIMLGTNDAKSQNWSKKDEFASDLTKMINYYRSLPSNPAVYIATSPTVYTNNMGGNVTDAVVSGEVVALQKQVAAEMKCPIVDINSVTKGNEKLFADGIHPNDDGYFAIAKAMSAIKEGYVNNDLASIMIDDKPLADFDSNVITYTMTLDKTATSVPVVSATTIMPDAKLDITQASSFGEKAVIKVTAEDGKTIKTYTIQFLKEGSESSGEQSSTDPKETSQKTDTNVSTDTKTSLQETSSVPKDNINTGRQSSAISICIALICLSLSTLLLILAKKHKLKSVE